MTAAKAAAPPKAAWSALDTALYDLLRIRSGLALLREQINGRNGEPDTDAINFILDACDNIVDAGDAAITPLVDRLRDAGVKA